MRTRSLALALALAVLPVSAAALDCIPVPGYDNMVLSYEDQDLVVALGTDRADYDLGEVIHFCLVLENTGTDTLAWLGANPVHAFCVLPDTCAAITQSGCLGASVYSYPEMVNFFGDGIRLEPGECTIRYASWDGRVFVYDGDLTWHWELPQAGPHRVFGGLWRRVPPDYDVYEYYVPAGSIWLTINLGPDVPVRPTSWGGLKTLYR
jgi:hypothetical protein